MIANSEPAGQRPAKDQGHIVAEVSGRHDIPGHPPALLRTGSTTSQSTIYRLPWTGDFAISSPTCPQQRKGAPTRLDALRDLFSGHAWNRPASSSPESSQRRAHHITSRR